MSQIRAARLAAGLTQFELAQRSGVSLRTIGAIERGRRGAQQGTKRRLLTALGIPFLEHHDYFA